MRLILIRHADPDYSIDSLTEKGWKEAEILSERIAGINVKEFYTSPLGRAKDTASVTLKKLNRTAIELPWLREFNAPVIDESTGKERHPWDFLPGEWTKIPEYYDNQHWYTAPVENGTGVRRHYGFTTGLMNTEKHGYERDGNIYRAVNPNTDTIVLFCHFGVTCVILSHLLAFHLFAVAWFCAAPTSLTTLVTEERRKGIAYFRVSSFGDTSHLYAAGEPPAFSGRYCEIYDNMII